MSIIEHDVTFVELPHARELEESVYWFSPSFLSAVNHHPLDDTIHYTKTRTFYVRWCETNTEQPRDDTASVTGLLAEEKHGHSGLSAWTNTRRTDGVILHRWIECILNGLPMLADTPLHQQVCSYYTERLRDRFIPWRTEMAIRSSVDIRLVGVVDALFVETTTIPGDILYLHLKDWKYSLDIQSCLEVYVTQLNMYKYILESHYTNIAFSWSGHVYTSIHIQSMELVVFHELATSYTIHAIPDEQREICARMECRKKYIN